MRLIDDDGVVALKESVAANGREKNAIGHHRDGCRITGPVGKAHAIADIGPEWGAEFVRESLRHGPGGNATRLGMGDARGALTAEGLKEHLGQLRGFARSCLAGDHDNLVVSERGDDVIPTIRDRQVCGVVNAQAGLPSSQGHGGTLSGSR